MPKAKQIIVPFTYMQPTGYYESPTVAFAGLRIGICATVLHEYFDVKAGRSWLPKIEVVLSTTKMPEAYEFRLTRGDFPDIELLESTGKWQYVVLYSRTGQWLKANFPRGYVSVRG